jgi:hypothetical protein
MKAALATVCTGSSIPEAEASAYRLAQQIAVRKRDDLINR